MAPVVDYPSFSSARTHLKEALDATGRGRTVTIARDGVVTAALSADRLRDYFFRTVSPRVRVFAESDAVVALMDDRPFAAEGVTIDAALADLIESLREYAEDWTDRLSEAPNHRDSWALVQLVSLSTDEQLRDWLDHGGE